MRGTKKLCILRPFGNVESGQWEEKKTVANPPRVCNFAAVCDASLCIIILYETTGNKSPLAIVLLV